MPGIAFFSRSLLQHVARSSLRCLLVAAGLVVAFLATSGVAAADEFRARQTLTGQIVELTNRERAQAGLPPLVVNEHLAQAAQSYADVLASGRCWAHTCGPEPDFAQRQTNAGYASWTHIGENLAGGQRMPEAAISGWMTSPTHRANILSSNFTEIGVGLAYGGRFSVYWTQEFGRRRGGPQPAPPVAQAPVAAAALLRPAASQADEQPPVEEPAPPAVDAVAELELESPVAPAPDIGPLELEMLALVNETRVSRNVPPLQWDPLMAAVARAHATDMMAHGVVSHAGSDGSTATQRLRRAGVNLVDGGENIWTFRGRPPEAGPATMHVAMMSEPHAPNLWNHIWNILYPGYKRIGIVVASNGVQYLSEKFAD